MRVKDLKIGTQLGIGLFVIISFVIITGAIAFLQTDALWRTTKTLYEHPLTVRRAVALLVEDVMTMHRDILSIALVKNDEEVQGFMKHIDVHEAEAHDQFDIISAQYLGPKTDIETAHAEFVAWKSIRDETIRLFREGKREEAVARVMPEGTGGSHVQKLLNTIDSISQFAKKKGDELYAGAKSQKDTFVVQLIVALGVILFASVFIGYQLLKGIRTPLSVLSDAAERFRAGEFDARSRYEARNEFGSLSVSFNNLAASLQNELLARQNALEVSGATGKEGDVKGFCRVLLLALLEKTGSNSGAVYLPEKDGSEFTRFESIGLGVTGKTKFSTLELEGEFGSALQSRKIIHLKIDVNETRSGFPTSVGDIPPREIITIPLVANDQVIAMLSLSSVNGYQPLALRVVGDVLPILAARMNSVLVLQKIKDFSARLERQNAELEAQKTELAVQTDELTQQNTELDMQKRQLDEANRLKSAFLSNMSHELRTPLNSVIALSGVLGRRLRGQVKDEEFEYLEIIERNGKQLLSLINDILDLSRIEAGKEELDIQLFSLRGLVDELSAMVGALAGEKGIALENEVPQDFPQVPGDEKKCRHVLQNLLGNAVKFTERGFVRIGADMKEGNLVVRVTDSGIGISDEQIPYIFDEFRQADESTSRKYGGTGLGLAIAKRYAILMGGDISVTSTPGTGSEFTFRMPLRPTDMQSPIPEIPVQATEKNVYRQGAESEKLILLVEDSEPAVIQMSDILGRKGYRLAVARNGREALERVAEKVPDAMILDLMMPEVDGFQVLRSIRGSESTSRLPVLILSAKHVTKDELGFLKGNHVQQLIQKGAVSGDELLAAVAGLVGLASPESNDGRPNQAASRVPRDVAPLLPGKSPSVLIVEDNPDNVSTLKALLGNDLAVRSVSDGAEGLRAAREGKPDLILMDISLPGIDGFETLRRIRSDLDLRNVPVLAITANAMKGDREEIIAAGFDGYISKPIDDTLLQDKIRELLHGN